MKRFVSRLTAVVIATLASSAGLSSTASAQSSPIVDAPPAAANGAQGAAPPSPSDRPQLPVGPTVGIGIKNPEEDKLSGAEANRRASTWIEKFGGSAFFTQTSMNLNTVAPNLQQARNSTVEQYLLFTPRYALSQDWQLRGRLTANYEYTDSDATTRRNEFVIGDAGLQLFYRGVPGFLGETKLNPFVGLSFPLSKESRARTMIVAPSVGLQLVHGFEHVLGGEMALIFSGAYSHPLYRTTTAGLAQERPYPVNCFHADGGGCSAQGSGAANPSDQFSAIFLLSGEWGKFSPGALIWMRWSVPYEFRDLPGVERLENRTAFRQGSYFAAFLDYHLTPWLTPELGYFMDRNTLSADGTVGNPIYSRYQDMRVYLGFNIQIDALYKTVTGQGAEGGVVRATNEKRPVMQF